MPNISDAQIDAVQFNDLSADPDAPASGRIRLFFKNGVAYFRKNSGSSSALSGVPIASMIDYAGTSAPTGWLLCDGTAVSRTTYADLFAVIGTTFGAGNGTTTFNLPDLRGRTSAGLDNLGGSSANRVTASAADALAGSVGEENHTLTTDEIPAHTHSKAAGYGYGSSNVGVALTPNAETTMTTSSVGGGSAHNNMQPTLFVGKIIKF